MAQSEDILPDKKVLTSSIDKCIENGKDLLNDADLLLDCDRFSTALALAVLAQEEFAKSFLLLLVVEGALPWLPEVRLSMNRHECKHLLTIVMDWLPGFDLSYASEFSRRSARRHQIMADYEAGKITGAVSLAKLDEDQVSFPEHVVRALNIYRHEKIESIGKRQPWRDEEWAKGIARKLADGARDQQKQAACFVDIGRTGAVTRQPRSITKAEAEQEIDHAKALAEARITWSDEFNLLKTALAEVFANLQAGSL